MKTIDVQLDSRFRVSDAEMLQDFQELMEALVQEFTYENQVHKKQKSQGVKITELEQICTFKLSTSGPVSEFSVPRGGWRRLRDKMREFGFDPVIEDNRCGGDHLIPRSFSRYTGPELWEHQQEALKVLLEKENCLIQMATGSGKTTVISAAIAELNKGERFTPTMIIVQSTRLMEQWKQRLLSELDTQVVGQIGSGVFDIQQVTVAMRQSLWALAGRKENNWFKLLESFGMVVADEVHQAAASTFNDVIDHFPAKYRVGVSADPSRKDGKEFLIYDAFGPVAYEISRDELEERGIIHDVHVVMVPTDFDAPWYKKQIEAKRKGSWKRPDYAKLIEHMTLDKPRNAIIKKLIEKMVCSSLQVLVFSLRVQHCRNLAEISDDVADSGLLLGGPANADAFKETCDLLKTGDVRYAVGTLQAIKASIDLPTVDRGIVTVPVHKNKQEWGQLRGRICRTSKDKGSAKIYVLWDRNLQGDLPLLNMLKWNNKVGVLCARGIVDGRKYLE